MATNTAERHQTLPKGAKHMQRETTYDPVFDAQGHYRLLLDAMARPGKINILPRMQITTPPQLTSAAALIGFALLNADASFFVDGSDPEVPTRHLLVNTSAKPVDAHKADFVFATGAASPMLAESMKKGSLPYPEEGATLVLDVMSLATEPQGLGQEGNGLALRLQGPGVAGERVLFVRGLNGSLIETVQQANIEFPLGIDLILTDGDGRMTCIPRSSRIRWEAI